MLITFLVACTLPEIYFRQNNITIISTDKRNYQNNVLILLFKYWNKDSQAKTENKKEHLFHNKLSKRARWEGKTFKTVV